MAEAAQAARSTLAGTKSVQDYIDELPNWADGTSLKSGPMTSMQWRIWSLAAAGKFFEGFVVFMTGVALPLVGREFHIQPAEKGIISAASLAGVLVGSVLLGGLSDYFGRKRMCIAEMIILCAVLALLILCNDIISLSICLFGLGLADTITAVASELDPRTPADERLGLVFAPSDASYPLINYEYVLVSIKQSDPARLTPCVTSCCGRSRRRRQRTEIT